MSMVIRTKRGNSNFKVGPTCRAAQEPPKLLLGRQVRKKKFFNFAGVKLRKHELLQ